MLRRLANNVGKKFSSLRGRCLEIATWRIEYARPGGSLSSLADMLPLSHSFLLSINIGERHAPTASPSIENGASKRLIETWEQTMRRQAEDERQLRDSSSFKVS